MFNAGWSETDIMSIAEYRAHVWPDKVHLLASCLMAVRLGGPIEEGVHRPTTMVGLGSWGELNSPVRESTTTTPANVQSKVSLFEEQETKTGGSFGLKPAFLGLVHRRPGPDLGAGLLELKANRGSRDLLDLVERVSTANTEQSEWWRTFPDTAPLYTLGWPPWTMGVNLTQSESVLFRV